MKHLNINSTLLYHDLIPCLRMSLRACRHLRMMEEPLREIGSESGQSRKLPITPKLMSGDFQDRREQAQIAEMKGQGRHLMHVNGGS